MYRRLLLDTVCVSLLFDLTFLFQFLVDSCASVSVSFVVLFSQGLHLCCSLHQLFSSRPDKFLKQATEWQEFFLPAVQESLLPVFMKGGQKMTVVGACDVWCMFCTLLKGHPIWSYLTVIHPSSSGSKWARWWFLFSLILGSIRCQWRSWFPWWFHVNVILNSWLPLYWPLGTCDFKNNLFTSRVSPTC